MNKSTSNHSAYLLFAACFLAASFFVLKTFMFGLLWGAVMAVSMWPLYELVTRKDTGLLRRWSPSWAAGLFALAFTALVLSPLVYGVFELVNAYAAGSNYVAQNRIQGVLSPPAFLNYLPLSDKLNRLWMEHVAHSAGFVELVNHVTEGRLMALVSGLWAQLTDKALTAVVMLIALHAMLRHGSAVQRSYRTVLAHWTGERSVSYVDSAVAALRGTINGVVLVGAVEGVLLAVPLLMGGVASGLLIGLAAGLLGVIPLLMPLLILPCLGYLYLAGQTTWAVVGAIDLALVWFVFENVVKPNVIGQKVRINTFLILAAMIGGLQALGLVGLFLGPALVSVAQGILMDLVRAAAPATQETN